MEGVDRELTAPFIKIAKTLITVHVANRYQKKFLSDFYKLFA